MNCSQSMDFTDPLFGFMTGQVGCQSRTEKRTGIFLVDDQIFGMRCESIIDFAGVRIPGRELGSSFIRGVHRLFVVPGCRIRRVDDRDSGISVDKQ